MTEQTAVAPALPRPDEWTRRDRGAWFKPAMLLCPVIAIAAVATAFQSLLTGLLLGAGALALLAAALVLPLPRPLRVSLQDVRLPDSVLRGPRFPIRRPHAALVAWSFFAVLFTLCAVGLAIMAVVEKEPSNLIGTALLGLLATVFVLAVIAYLRRDRTNPPSVTVAEPGIVVVGNTARFIGWDDVTGVTATVQDLLSGWWSIRQNAITIKVRGSAGPTRGRLRLFASYLVGNDDEAVRNVQLDSDPVVTYHALRFYCQNPELRRELGTEAAVERIRSGRMS